MIKHIYLAFLFAIFLSYIISSTCAYAQSQLQTEINSYNYGSASTGWDSINQTGVNPNSDVYGVSVYDPAYNKSALPVNRDSVSAYTANAPSPGAASNAQSTGAINPGFSSNPYLPEQFMASSPLPNTSRRNLTPLNPQQGSGLPPTILDSFVRTSGMSDSIYGDEGSIFPPMAGNFSYISSGFDSNTRQGLTTGHGSLMPSAWGGDEFHGNEHSVSGPNYSSSSLNTTAPALTVPAN
jgi:hypothetical protein